jgi:hypothetical protein
VALGSATAQGQEYRVVDRRALDGSVLLVRRVAQRQVATQVFLAARHWELTPASDFFRLRGGRPLPAGHTAPQGDPPAVTFRNGEVVRNSWTNLMGGRGSTTLSDGEILRLVRIVSPFKTVRLDLESVCRPREHGRHLRARIDFLLSAPVGARTLEEANRAAAAVLEPVDLSRVLEICDPETALPPFTLRPGLRASDIERVLGSPREISPERGSEVRDYGVVRLLFRGAHLESIAVPALD